jgi:AraC family transcriptional regulator
VTLLSFHAGAYAGGLHQPAHRHDDLHLSLVMRGRIAETVGGATEYAGALSVVAKDPGVVHADRFGPEGAAVARLSLPGGGVGDLIESQQRAFPWRWAHDLAVATPFVRLVHRAGGTDTSFDAADTDVVDLLAALTARPVSDTKGAPPRWLVLAIERLREEWRPRMRVAEVARDAGVHPVYLARCARRWYGVGIAELMRRERMRAATAGIATAAESVSAVAHGTGFADEAHLCREFRRATGTTPGRFRTLVRAVDGNRRAG